MALARRARTSIWIARHNVVTPQFASNASIEVRPVLQLALHWSRSVSSLYRSSVVNASISAHSSVVASPSADPAARADQQHRWTRHEEPTDSRTLMREIVERTRRLEERVRVEKRLALRSAPSTAAVAEAQDAARRSGPDWWKWEPAQQAARPAPAPAVNINEIAETVMRRLDNRVTAWRERMGRM
jgi:hypothetical protein